MYAYPIEYVYIRIFCMTNSKMRIDKSCFSVLNQVRFCFGEKGYTQSA